MLLAFACSINMEQLDAYVLGRSLSDVDLPYILALLKVPSISSAFWCSEQERSMKYDRLVALGVDSKRVSTVLWTDYWRTMKYRLLRIVELLILADDRTSA